ncbi:hypothetical protein KRX57_08090 [Weeksellaceae bacterium TAE3-ERU29]|nr:hypothetical protein [Weeksellaceae bacterium TAE3-ERU29]
MYSLILFLLILSVILILNTSKRAELNKSTIEIKIQNHKNWAKYSAIVFSLISLWLSLWYFNVSTVGFLIWFLSLVAAYSCVIILNPLKIFSWKSLLILFGVLIITESLIHFYYAG